MSGDPARLPMPKARRRHGHCSREDCRLDKQRHAHLANANACTGAIQLAEALIVDLEGGRDGG
jgi:hypothetical protein